MEQTTGSVAQRLKGLRQTMEILPEEMALIAGVSLETYLAYEAGVKDPSFTELYRCAGRLRVDISEIVTGQDPKLSFYTLARKGLGMPIKRREGFDYQHMASLMRHRFAEPFVVTAKYSAADDAAAIHLSSHPGQEFDYVLKGQLKVQLEDRVEVLQEGDSLYYDATHPHGMVATGGQDCEFLAIVMKGDSLELPQPQPAQAPERSATTGRKLLYQQYLTEQLDEHGNLAGVQFHYPENFNFAFDVVDTLAATCPDKTAMLWLSSEKEEKRITFAEMAENASRAANYFASLGIQKGDRVMLVLKRHYQFWYSILALHKLGAVVIPATHQLVAKDFIYRFDAAGVKAVVCTSEDAAAAEIDAALPESPTLKLRIMANGSREGWLNFDEALPQQPATFARPTGDQAALATDPMLMYFTSGTTGYPKIATHNFTYPLGHILTARWWQNVDPDGLHFTISDTGWGKAVWGKLYGQWLCEAPVFTYDFQRFDAADLLPLFAKYKITTFCAPPTMYRMFIKEKLADYDLSSLKHATIAGEALNPEVFQQFYNATGLKLMEGFGQTETTLTIANLLGTQPKPGSMGKPSPQYQVDLLGADGKPVKAGEVGEIVVRTSDAVPVGMFTGYYRNDEKTQAVWFDDAYHTGDMAWRDEDGYFWYVGRTDDLIKSSGYRIGPFEIESVIMELPYVLECAVTGVPDEVRGQVVKATIVLVKGTEPTEALKQEIQEYVKEHTAPYKYPRIVEFVEGLPKTISGKIRRVELR